MNNEYAYGRTELYRVKQMRSDAFEVNVIVAHTSSRINEILNSRNKLLRIGLLNSSFPTRKIITHHTYLRTRAGSFL